MTVSLSRVRCCVAALARPRPLLSDALGCPQTDDGSNMVNASSNVVYRQPLWKTDFGGHTKSYSYNVETEETKWIAAAAVDSDSDTETAEPRPGACSAAMRAMQNMSCLPRTRGVPPTLSEAMCAF